MDKKIVCFDFDGVIATYDGWKGFDVLGKPIQKTINVMKKLKDKGYFITIFTTRVVTPKLLKWLEKYEVPYDSINSTAHNPPCTSFKPIYHCVVDDRAINPVLMNEEQILNKIETIVNQAISGSSPKAEATGDWSLFIGRFQPLHEGHIKLIRTVLNEGGKVCIGLRDTPINDKNPFTIEQRCRMFEKEFKKEIEENRLKIVVLPDIKEVCHGRKVGWYVREIRLDKETESISATKIREKWKEK